MSVQFKDDDIVITGISGRLPESSNIEEFKENLMKGMDMVTEDDRRWPVDTYDLPRRIGKIKDLESFDASFFGINFTQANVTDPQLRILLEVTYEAIVDAGINPTILRGSRTGVFVGVTSSEALEFWTETVDRVNGYGMLGCCRSMFANRISFAFDFVGPSFTLDAACASSMIALHQAVAAIRAGECDAAIVAGSNLVLQPLYSLHFKKLHLSSQDGKCKTFDNAADGMVRAEAVTAIYVQKLKDAHRVYATVIHSKTNTDGYKSQGITFINSKMQNKLMCEMYNEAGIDPTDVIYVEAHGTGTKIGDVQEGNSIDETFCKNRKTPLLIGSVKSNMGHTEAASALCSLIKVLIAMETGVIPGNLHFNIPNSNIPALSEGRLQVVHKTIPWNGGLVGINSFGFGGTNAHVLLRSNPKPKLPPVLGTTELLPKLLVVSGRTKEAVHVLLDEAKKHRKDEEFISLLHAVHSNDIPGHRIRGYEVLSDDDTRELVEIETNDTSRPVWFIFSGMGSQWPGMGRELLGIETFQRSLQRSADALKTHGIDLMNVIMNGLEETYENIIYSFVSIVAIQIALVDVLMSIGIHPAGIIGHSVGELCCAYCDDETFTLEQTILAAYYRGKAIIDFKLEPGAMAAVGLSWEEAKKICPFDVVPACHNSKDLVTISGPIESVQTFVEELKSKNVFAKIINSSGVAFHSKYIAPIESKLRASFDKIISKPRQRSSKWISSSIPEVAWDSPLARFNSSDYHINNTLSPVLFQEAITHIPDNAITIEIAPHCLLQAILCRSLPPTITKISLQKRNHPSNLTFLLSNIGKLYMAGAQPNISKLYPSLNFPVGRGTPMIGHLVKWDHSIKWDVPKYKQTSGQQTSNEYVQVDLSEKMYSYLAGHKIDGQIVFPSTGCLFLVWKIFAQIQNTQFERLPVIFEEIRFQRAIFMSKKEPTKLSINILKRTGKFEVCETNTVIVSGNIRAFTAVEEDESMLPPLPEPFADDENFTLTSKEIYKELSLRGYEYGGIFQSIKSCDKHAIIGELCWYNEWIPYINSMLQFGMLCNSRKLLYASYMQYLTIDPLHHKQLLEQLSKDEALPVHHHKNINIIKSGGTEIKGLEFSSATRCQQPQANPKYEQYTFVPYEYELSQHEDPLKRKLNALTALLQIMVENVMTYNIKIVEVAGERAEELLLAPLVRNILHGEPMITIDMQVAVSSDNYAANLSQMNIDIVVRDAKNVPPAENVHLVIAANVLSNQSHIILNNLIAALNPNGFILLEETSKQLELQNVLINTNVVLAANHIDPSGKNYILLKKQEKRGEPIIIEIAQKHLSWLETLKTALKKSNKDQDVLLVCQGEEIVGVIGFVTCIRREIFNIKTRYVYDQSKYSPKFNTSADFFKKQLDKELIANVYKDGKWGSYRHLQLDNQSNTTTVEHAYVDSLVKGDLSSLRWIESPLNYYKPDKSPNSATLCKVYYAPINCRDVMLANGELSLDLLPERTTTEDYILGLEFSGKDMNGDRVMGMVKAGGLATTVMADPNFLWKVPDKWTLEEAATIPIAYATSYYALFVRGQLKAGESVLIHNGTDDVSQAAITIALHAGCTIFTTVDTQEKRRYITKTFPQLIDECIGNSQDTSFKRLILTRTQKRGVDVVLNSLANEKLQAGIRCLAKHGRFLDLSNNNCSTTTEIAMLSNNATFHSIMLNTLFEDDAEKRKVMKLVQEGIDNNVIRPLPRIVFLKDELEEGFRFVATCSHIEKVLLQVQQEESRLCTPQLSRVTAVRRTYMNSKKSYVLIGGLGGLGLEIANWLIIRGAKYIVFVSRSGIRTGYQAWFVQRWRENGVKVIVSTEDITTLSGATRMIEESDRLAPIGGIFNLAAVLRDGIIQNLKEADFNAVMSSKIDITRNLDMVSAHYYSQLDYFIVFSSMSAGRGNAGQCNYGFANSAMERLIEKRYASGKPGRVIQWSAIADVGLLIDSIGDDNVIIAGIAPQRISSVLETFNIFLQLSSYPVLSTIIIPEKHKSADNKEVRLAENIASILGIKDVSLVNPNDSLNVLGMDSLMDIEVQQTLEMNYNIVLSSKEIRELTISKLRELQHSSVMV